MGRIRKNAGQTRTDIRVVGGRACGLCLCVAACLAPLHAAYAQPSPSVARCGRDGPVVFFPDDQMEVRSGSVVKVMVAPITVRVRRIDVLLDDEPVLAFGDGTPLPVDPDGRVTLQIPVAVGVAPAGGIGLAEGGNRITVRARDTENRCGERTATAFAGSADVYAVLVGINEYLGTSRSLRYARNDAVQIRTHLENALKVPRRNIRLLTDPPRAGDAQIADRADATRIALLDALTDIELMADDRSTLIVFLSLHGFASDDAVMYAERQYFVLHDSDQSRSYKMLPKPLLEYHINRIKSRRKIVLLDACYSGSVTAVEGELDARVMSDAKAFGSKSLALLQSSIVGAYTMASSRADQLSWEFEDFNHGVFTHFLLQASKDAQDVLAPHNVITLSEVYEYMKGRVSDEVQKRKKVAQNIDRTVVGNADDFPWAFK